ncbi:MAG TPA: hypothetical protein VGS96_16485 [Thermoanaerobaculia bacterium]|jgi:hypothetical protein|nr:hypothetical protein [Thermoanaerobaculia bacterium]
MRGEERAETAFAVDDVALVIIERDAIQIEMRRGVVAEIESVVEPEGENALDLRRSIATAAAIHESDGGDSIATQRADQILIESRERAEVASVSFHLTAGEIVQGDGDPAAVRGGRFLNRPGGEAG